MGYPVLECAGGARVQFMRSVACLSAVRKASKPTPLLAANTLIDGRGGDSGGESDKDGDRDGEIGMVR